MNQYVIDIKRFTQTLHWLSVESAQAKDGLTIDIQLTKFQKAKANYLILCPQWGLGLQVANIWPFCHLSDPNHQYVNHH